MRVWGSEMVDLLMKASARVTRALRNRCSVLDQLVMLLDGLGPEGCFY